MKCYEGHILSVNANNDVFRYLVEDKGKILYVGNTLPDAYAHAEKVELGKRALIPSFADTHQHFASFSTFQAGLNVMDAESNEEISEMIRQFVSRSKGKTLICFGASPYSVREGRLISREELDAVCPDKEILVAEEAGVLLGFAILHRVHKPENPFIYPRDYLDIDEFGVDAAHRRQGIATALVNYLRDYARAQGFDRVELNMWEFNREALAFYEGAGFTTYRRYLEMKLT